MKGIVLAAVGMAMFVLALPATSSADWSDLDGPVKTASLAPAVCTKKVCRVEATCPPEGGGYENFPGTINDGPNECDFELALFGEKPLIGRVNRLVFGMDTERTQSGPEDRVEIQPGTTQMTTWPVTSFGRKSITRALRAGKQKVKGEWEMVAFFRLGHVTDDGQQLIPRQYYGHRTGPVRIILKGKSGKK